MPEALPQRPWMHMSVQGAVCHSTGEAVLKSRPCAMYCRVQAQCLTQWDVLQLSPDAQPFAQQGSNRHCHTVHHPPAPHDFISLVVLATVQGALL